MNALAWWNRRRARRAWRTHRSLQDEEYRRDVYILCGLLVFVALCLAVRAWTG
jgi:hypothetical protein